jgi:hypothetical protein
MIATSFVEKHWLPTWEHRLTKNRKTWHLSICLLSFVQPPWNQEKTSGRMSRNTETMQMLECWEYNMHTCPTPMTFPLMSSTSPHPPSQPSYPMPIPLQPPFSHHKMPLSECYSDGQGSLSGLLSLIKTCCLWRLQIFFSVCSSFWLLHFPFNKNDW